MRHLFPLLLGLLAVVLLIVDATTADDVDVYPDMEAWIDDICKKVTK